VSTAPPRSAGGAPAARKPEMLGFALAGDPCALVTVGRGDLHASNCSMATRIRPKRIPASPVSPMGRGSCGEVCTQKGVVAVVGLVEFWKFAQTPFGNDGGFQCSCVLPARGPVGRTGRPC
jgi:hypothetical protein